MKIIKKSGSTIVPASYPAIPSRKLTEDSLKSVLASVGVMTDSIVVTDSIEHLGRWDLTIKGNAWPTQKY